MLDQIFIGVPDRLSKTRRTKSMLISNYPLQSRQAEFEIRTRRSGGERHAPKGRTPEYGISFCVEKRIPYGTLHISLPGKLARLTTFDLVCLLGQ